MISQPVIHLFASSKTTRTGRVKGLMKNLDSGRPARTSAKPARTVSEDPYLLLLLADQELSNGREEQASYLIDSAYEVFDRRAAAAVYQLYLVG